jgi:general stress protein CsbA
VAATKNPSGDAMTSRDLFHNVNDFLNRNFQVLFYTSLGLSFLFAALLFDLKVSIGGDDSAYIYRAARFVESGEYPSFQGPLYPLLISPLIALFGINLFLIKLLSLIFTVGQIFFLYKGLKNRIPNLVLIPSALLVAVNCSVAIFGGLTYSEAMYMCLQALFIAYVARNFVRDSAKDFDLKKDWKIYLIMGLLLTLLFLTRSIGIGAAAAIILFLLLRGQLLPAVFTTGAFAAVLIPYQLLKNVLFGSGTHMEEQGKGLLLKDPYKPEQGNEDLTGFITRLIENSKLYLSKRLAIVLNIRPEDATTVSVGLTVLMVVLILAGVIYAYRKNFTVFFIGVYSVVMCLLTFVVLQTRWDQERMIMVYVAPLLITIFFGLYSFFRTKRVAVAQPLYFILFALLLILGMTKTLGKVPGNLKALRKNISGDIYYGYTTDLVNFLKMSEYTATNLPKEAVVVSRKPTISSIYANGKEFVGLYVVPSSDPDSCLAWCKRNKVEYLIDASLRQNPKKNTGRVISTIRMLLYPISQKYPEKIKMVHQIGQTEPAYLYQIIY